MIGILDLRSMGYYKIKQGILHFNRFINTLKREKKEKMQDKYPWLDSSDERKYMSDREILDKYVDFDKSYLTDEERKQVMDMLYKVQRRIQFKRQIRHMSK